MSVQSVKKQLSKILLFYFIDFSVYVSIVLIFVRKNALFLPSSSCNQTPDALLHWSNGLCWIKCQHCHTECKSLSGDFFQKFFSNRLKHEIRYWFDYIVTIFIDFNMKNSVGCTQYFYYSGILSNNFYW